MASDVCGETITGRIVKTLRWIGFAALTRDPSRSRWRWRAGGLISFALVNSIHPGQIADTGFFQSGGDAFAHAARAAIPLHRQGTPAECAELVLFLASDDSSFISGAEIAIDGGYIAAGLASLRNRVRDEYASRGE